MTQASFNNYVANLMYHHAEYVYSLVSKLQTGKCNIDCDLYKHRIATAFIYKLIRCYELYPGDDNVTVGTGTVNFNMGSLDINCLKTDFTYTPVIGDGISSTALTTGITITNVVAVSILGVWYYTLTLSDYPIATGLASYTVTGNRSGENPNCLTRTEMQEIVAWLNNLYQTGYCVDFIQP